VLLASGATAGMSAIFGSPIAAIFLAVELLLFEFSPRSLIPVSLACITGAAGHHLLFSSEPVFAMPEIVSPPNTALAAYSVIGIVIGLLAASVTKAVYYIEDLFEKLPVHWMWWPAIGGLAVGIVGYFYPATLGVGYENISHLLTGNMTLRLVLSLCIFKFISWAIALGSGTSGGTLAPLLTIGGATGCLLGMVTIALFPQYGVVLPLAALVGMSAMFAGASRALLTSIVFALETTSQANALLPLLGACVASYFVSFFLMRNTIMTEKIARRGVKTPHSYQQDLLEAINVEQVMSREEIVLNEKNTIDEVRGWLSEEKEEVYNHFIVVNDAHEFTGLLDSHTLFNKVVSEKDPIGSLVTKHIAAVQKEDSLRAAVELMAKENSEVLPVLDEGKAIVGVLTYKDIIGAYRQDAENYIQKDAQISMKKQGLKLLLKGRKLVVSVKRKDG
jgi:CBS domain-containing protein